MRETVEIEMTTYTDAEIAAQEREATPWPEIEARADAAKTREELDAVVKLIESERPWIGGEARNLLAFIVSGHGDLVPPGE